MLSWGLDHLYTMTGRHTDIDMLVGLPDSAKYPMKATLTEERPVFDPAKIKMLGQRFHIMVDRLEFEATELPMVRGLVFETTTDPCVKYELVIDPKGSHFYNDPERRKLVFITTEKSC